MPPTIVNSGSGQHGKAQRQRPHQHNQPKIQSGFAEDCQRIACADQHKQPQRRGRQHHIRQIIHRQAVTGEIKHCTAEQDHVLPALEPHCIHQQIFQKRHRLCPQSGTSTFKRLLLGYCITDEVFGASISVEGNVDPLFTYGAMMIAVPGWSLGTLCGVLLGSVLPVGLVSALSVSLYGMFISVFIPEAKRNRIVAALVLISFAASFAFMKIPLFDGISSGIKIIILTVVISLLAAIIFPVKEEGDDNE